MVISLIFTPLQFNFIGNFQIQRQTNFSDLASSVLGLLTLL